MPMSEHDEFVAAYTKVLVASWTDDAYAARLDADPRDALAEHGLHVPAGSQLVVTRSIPRSHAEGGVEVAVSKWEAGRTTGIYVVSVPASPEVELGELSDDDLLSISGASLLSCCCCTPCCSCS